jgi:hypothetical protein
MPMRPCHTILLFATLAAAACTTMTIEERGAACRATDWASYGQNDGILGVSAAERTEKFSDCAALGYPADIAAYQTARAEGLKTYCTVENGYEVGYAGRRYRNVCPPELEPAFLQGYEQGRKERPPRDDYYPYYGFGYYNYPYWWFGRPYPGHYWRR